MKDALIALAAILFLAGGHLAARAQSLGAPPTGKDAPGFVAESGRFAFFSHYWLNMHHFLHRRAVSSGSEEAGSARSAADIDVERHRAVGEADKEALEAAVSFYEENLVGEDLRSSDYVQAFKAWVVGQGRTGFASPVPARFREHTERLAAFAPVYQRYFGDVHRRAGHDAVSENLRLVRTTEDTVAQSLTDWSQAYWPSGKVRVDVAYYTKAPQNRAFTTIFPVHVVVPPEEPGTPTGHWVEILYHEAGHQFVRSRSGFVAGTLEDVSEVTGHGLRSLWHAYLFYFAGTATGRALLEEGIEGYEMYMVRNEVFGLYFPSLQEHLPAYTNREATLAEVTRSIVEDVCERAGWD